MIRNIRIFGSILAAALAMFATSAARAEPPSFDYVQFDYVLSGDTAIEEGSNSVDVDLQRGYAVKGSFTAGDVFMVSGEAHDLDYDDKDGDLLNTGESVIVNDLTFIGAGGHMAVADAVEIYGLLGLTRPTLAAYTGDGIGLKVGARAGVGVADLGLWYLTADTDTKIADDSLDIDPAVFGLDAAFRFAPDAPELVIGYVDGTFDLSGTGIDAETAFSHGSIGVRQSF